MCYKKEVFNTEVWKFLHSDQQKIAENQSS